MAPQAILETAIYSNNLLDAEKFYTDVLGLSLLSKGDNHYLFFVCGGAMLEIFHPGATAKRNGPIPAHTASGTGHIAFRINEEDFDCWRELLKEKGIEIESEIDWPKGGHSLYFRDPAGNSLELTTPRTWGL